MFIGCPLSLGIVHRRSRPRAWPAGARARNARGQRPGRCGGRVTARETAARTLGRALYDLLRKTCGQATPERRTAFRNRLDQPARRIPDKALSDEYRDAVRGLFYAARRRDRAAPLHCRWLDTVGAAEISLSGSSRDRGSSGAYDYCQGTRSRKCSTSSLNCPGSCRNEKWLTSGWISSPLSGMLDAMNSVFSRLIASSWSASTIQVGT